jgi:methyl-accepting chemotaxis protein
MLDALLAPAMGLMSRLRFGLKIGLIGLLFLAPLMALLMFLYGRLNAEILLSETERLGVPQIVAARQAVQALQLHRGATVGAMQGDQAPKGADSQSRQ